LKNPLFRTNADRLTHAEELDVILRAFIAQRDQSGNVAFFEQAEVTVGPVYDISQIVEDPHVVESELLADYPDAEMGNLPMHHPVPRFYQTPASIRSPAPRLGEHNRELLREIGLSDAGYEELLGSGVAFDGDSQPGAIEE
jgi:formyl-CoA transferase